MFSVMCRLRVLSLLNGSNDVLLLLSLLLLLNIRIKIVEGLAKRRAARGLEGQRLQLRKRHQVWLKRDARWVKLYESIEKARLLI